MRADSDTGGVTEVPSMRVAAADRFFLCFDGAQPPPSCIWTFLLEGAPPPDAQRLRTAVAAAVAAHPKAACRIASRSSWSPPLWERLPRSELDLILEAPRPRTADEGELLDDVVSRFHRAFDVSRGPLLRLEWRRVGAADGALVFHFHHALGDGSGSLAVLRDAIRAYGGLPIDEPAIPASAPRVRLRGLLRYAFAQARHVPFRAPDHVYDANTQPTGRLDLAHRRFPAPTLAAAAVSRTTGPTAVLAAACALAVERFRKDRRRSCRHIRLGVSVSLRDQASWHALDNRSAAVSVSIAPADCAEPGRLAATIQQRLRLARRHRVAESMAALAPSLLIPTPIAAALVRRLARARGLDSLFLANVGNLAVAGEPIDAWIAPLGGCLRRAWVLSRPAEGIGATLNVCVAGDAVHLSLCFLRGLLNRDDAERLLDLVVAFVEESPRRDEVSTL